MYALATTDEKANQIFHGPFVSIAAIGRYAIKHRIPIWIIVRLNNYGETMEEQR